MPQSDGARGGAPANLAYALIWLISKIIISEKYAPGGKKEVLCQEKIFRAYGAAYLHKKKNLIAKIHLENNFQISDLKLNDNFRQK